MRMKTGRYIVLSGRGSSPDYLAGRFDTADEAEDRAGRLCEEGEDARVLPEVVDVRSDECPY